MLFFHFHAGLYAGHADADIWLTVYSHETRGTVADGTKKTSWTVQMGTVSQCADASRMQGGGDGFVGKAGDGLTVIVKNDGLSCKRYALLSSIFPSAPLLHPPV